MAALCLHCCLDFIAAWDCSWLQCACFSWQWFLLLWSTGSRLVGFSSFSSRALECRLKYCGTRAYSCSLPHGIFPDQESNLCFLHQWQILTTEPQGGPLIFQIKVLCSVFHGTLAHMNLYTSYPHLVNS